MINIRQWFQDLWWW